eukprot:14573553-Alexandrium_andersonii.AAC.1
MNRLGGLFSRCGGEALCRATQALECLRACRLPAPSEGQLGTSASRLRLTVGVRRRDSGAPGVGDT